MTTLSGKFWENGSGSIGFDTSSNRRARKERLDTDLYNYAYNTDNFKKQDYEICGEYVGSWTNKEALENGLLTQKDVASLGLSNATILRVSRSKRCRKGLRGLSSFGRLNVQNAALRLQRELTKPCLGLLTLTLPNFPEEFYSKLESSHFTILLKSVYAWLRRKLKKARLEEAGFVGVTEIQEKRLKATGKVYPHWHFIVPIKKHRHLKGGTASNPWVIDLNYAHQEFEEIVWRWFHRLRKDLGLNSNGLIAKFKKETKTFACSVDLHPIKKDASAYISKYLSKGSTIAYMQSNNMLQRIPFKWWYVESALKGRVRDRITPLRGKIAEHLFYEIEEFLHCKYVSWFAYMQIEVSHVCNRIQDDDNKETIGVSFRLTREGIAHIYDCLDLI